MTDEPIVMPEDEPDSDPVDVEELEQAGNVEPLETVSAPRE